MEKYKQTGDPAIKEQLIWNMLIVKYVAGRLSIFRINVEYDLVVRRIRPDRRYRFDIRSKV